MTSDAMARVRLADAPDETRSTATLVASLGARISMLTMISGASAIGSLMAGFAALGREVGRTVEGARLRDALASGRAGQNVAALWKALRIDSWATGAAPSPVLDHLRNDLALLLAGDLDETLALLPIPGAPSTATADDDTSADGVDCLLGMWFYSREMTRAIEALAAGTLEPAGRVVRGDRPRPEPPGPLLR
jgi:hypothetical protein